MDGKEECEGGEGVWFLFYHSQLKSVLFEMFFKLHLPIKRLVQF